MATEEQVLHIDVRYEAEDEILIAEVRELQGCVAMGRSEQELFENLKTAIEDYFELFHNAEVVKVSDPVKLPDLSEPQTVQYSEVRVLAAC